MGALIPPTVVSVGGSVTVRTLAGTDSNNNIVIVDTEYVPANDDPNVTDDNDDRTQTAVIHYEISGANVDYFQRREITLEIDDNQDPRDDPITAILLPNVTGLQRTEWDGRFVVVPPATAPDPPYGMYYAHIRLKINLDADPDWEKNYPSNAHPITVYSYPVADAGGDQTVHVGDTVTFDGSGSHDPDDGTTSGAGINRYFWDFGDGTISGVNPGSAPTHPYNHPGKYEVTLTVYDNDTPQRIDTDEVTIDSIVEVALADPTMERGAPTAITATITPSTYTPHRIEWVFTKEDAQGAVLSTTTRNTGTAVSTTITMVDGDSPYFVEIKLYHQYPGETTEKLVASDKKKITVTARSWSASAPTVDEDFDKMWGDFNPGYAFGMVVNRGEPDAPTFVSHYNSTIDKHLAGYTPLQINDPNGPNHGYWYISETILYINLGTRINQYIKPNEPAPHTAPPPPGQQHPNFYGFNNTNCSATGTTQGVLTGANFLEAVKGHENAGRSNRPGSNGHCSVIEAQFALPGNDLHLVIEGISSSTSKNDLVGKTEDELIILDMRIRPQAVAEYLVSGNWKISTDGYWSQWDSSHQNPNNHHFSPCHFGKDF